jgi:ligand-binding sensor domain-containing protein
VFKTLCISLILFVVLPAGSIAQQYHFRNYTVKDGVAQSQVYSLLQDKRGYLWMGTRGGGLTRFDGINFQTFTEKDGLVNNYVSRIREDAQHNLWIGTNNGISCYNGVKFRNYQPTGYAVPVSVQEITFDPRGRMWLATNVGVLLFENGEFKNISEALKQGQEMIYAVNSDKSGQIRYGNGKGLFGIVEKNGRFSLIRYSEQSPYMRNAITAIQEDASGKLWIGTYGDGVYCYADKRFSRIDWNNALYKQTVLDIYFDRQGNVWLATLSKGVAQYNADTHTFSWLTENEGLSNNHVRSIIQDNGGSFWFGTSGGGACNYLGKQFTTYDKSSGLGGNFIYSIYRDSKNRLWSGTSQNGVSMLDSQGFSSFNASNGFENVKVKAICEDLQGNLYFGTDGQGIYRYDGETFSQLAGLRDTYVRAIVRDKAGDLWVASAGNGLLQLTPGESQLDITAYLVADGMLSNRLTCLHLDKKDRLWYGTESNGIGLLVRGEIQRQNFRTKNGLPSNSIRCFAEDQSGYLWIGTAGSGIASIRLQSNQFSISTYDYTDGLASSNIYLLTTDQQNNLIAGSESGLDYISLNARRKFAKIKHYSKGDGFTGVETCQNSVFNDADGTIWFGTINGLSKYNPAYLVRNQQEPITSITDVKLFYESISNTPYKSATGDWNEVNSLQLPYDQNHLSFDFLAINFSNPEAVRYQWKLVGFDPAWSPLSKEHSIVYSNISPGKYTFLVKACNEDGVWNREPRSISVTISAPVWLRWWFIALEIIAVLTCLSLLFRWQVNRVRRKATEEQQKLQLEKEVVELEQKALRLQMNPHFIFNALNSIQSQIGTGKEQEARYYLAKFSRLMRQILDNSRNTVITLEEEVNTLENYLLIEKFCNGERFDYEITIDKNIEQDFVKIPPMLLQPFVENAIKHGMKFHDADARGLIEIAFHEKGNLLECSVTDNGIGRTKAGELNKSSKETYHQSTALLVTQERLDLLNENKHLQSLEIIDLYHPDGSAAGTQVIVRIPII